jgi:DNA-binding transcriptional ArsR family regulator
MIKFRFSVDALGNTRFGYSPLAEVASSLRVLGSAAEGGFVLQPWLRETRDGLQTVDMQLLRAVAPAGPFAPDCLYVWSSDPKTTIDDQLEGLAALPLEQLTADLAQVWPRGVPPVLVELLADAAAARRLADAIWDYWQIAVGPYWLRIRAVIDDDVSHRASQVLAEGLFGLLTDLHPEVSVRDRTLFIDKPHHKDVCYGDADLVLIPSVFIWPHLMIGHDNPGNFELTYAARGIGRVWEGLSGTASDEDPLGQLIGRTRARILKRLSIPMTTTQLARGLEQSPGTVNAHLSVLRRAGLLTSWRSGRSVLYRRTPLAASIVSAAEAEGTRNELA